MFCSSHSGVAHGFSYVRFSAGTIAFVFDMRLVLVSVLEFKYLVIFRVWHKCGQSTCCHSMNSVWR